MGADTSIAWTSTDGVEGATFNPWWGCSKVSRGCLHCYAETWAKRTGKGCFGLSPRRTFGDKHWAEPLKWADKARKAKVRRKVFCASMADVFEDAPGLSEHRARLWPLIEATRDALDWLLLTKRPENVPLFASYEALRSCWLGVTCEGQAEADARLPFLLNLNVPAAVRFASVEPMLGPVDLSQWLPAGYVGSRGGQDSHDAVLDWVIVGGESGPGARPLDLAWARDVIAQCLDAATPAFFKQLGRGAYERVDSIQRDSPDLLKVMSQPPPPDGWTRIHVPSEGKVWLQRHITTKDRDGRAVEEWPQDLRVQEFPR